MELFKFLQAICLLVLALCFPASANPKAALPKEKPFKVVEAPIKDANMLRQTAEPGAQGSMHRVSGQIAAGSKSLLSFRVPGFIQKIAAKPGDRFKKGDILATLDPSDYLLQLSLAKANKNQAQVQENMAQNDYNREKQLKQEGASTGALVELAEFKLKQAQISLQLADINLKTAEQNLERTKLRAPYNCVASNQFKDNAERVGIETTVFEVYEENNSEVNLNVPENLVGKLIIGNKIKVSVPSANCVLDAEITGIVGLVSESSRTFKVRAKFQNSNNKVVPGLFAEAQIN